MPDPDLSVAQWVYTHHQAAGLGTDTLPSATALYVPLRAPMRTRGWLAIAPAQDGLPFAPEQQLPPDTFAAPISPFFFYTPDPSYEPTSACRRGSP